MINKDEIPFDYLQNAIAWLESEQRSYLEDLPTVESVLEYFNLWSIYGTEFMECIHGVIEEGYDPKPLNDFIDKYKLNWCKYINGKWKADHQL